MLGTVRTVRRIFELPRCASIDGFYKMEAIHKTRDNVTSATRPVALSRRLIEERFLRYSQVKWLMMRLIAVIISKPISVTFGV